MNIKRSTMKKHEKFFQKKEWPGVEEPKNYNVVVKPELLITELWRLSPYYEGEYVRFSPVKMPNIKIGCIRIIGIILYVSCNKKQYKFTVDDGSGQLNVICSFKHFNTIEKGNMEKDQDSKDKPKDKDLVAGSYVYMEGFLSLTDYKKDYRNSEGKRPVGMLLCAQPVLYAVKVEFINEAQYLRKMYIWIQGAKRRYNSMISS